MQGAGSGGFGVPRDALTPAWHDWQNESPKHHTREYAREDYCGFWLDAPEWKEFNGNPEELRGRVANPERVTALNPGEAYRLTKLDK